MASNNQDMEKQPLLPANRRRASATGSEPTLSELQRDMYQAQRRYLRAWSRTTAGSWHRWIMISVSALLSLVSLLCVGVVIQDALSSSDDPLPGSVARKIPLEAHIMSKCPDARDCLHDLILPAMQRVGDLVDFRLSYIGSETDHDDGVLCMHGPTECVGDIIELCAAAAYPDPRLYLGFTMCLSRDYEHIPERSLVEDCALEHGIDMEKLEGCTVDKDGELSVNRLKESFRRSKAANVTKSCTVRLDDKVRCIRDGGEWSDCEGGSRAEDLVKDVRKLASLEEWL